MTTVKISNIGGDPFRTEEILADFINDLLQAGADRVFVGDEEWPDVEIHDRPVRVEGLDLETVKDVWDEYEDEAQGLTGPDVDKDNMQTSKLDDGQQFESELNDTTLEVVDQDGDRVRIQDEDGNEWWERREDVRDKIQDDVWIEKADPCWDGYEMAGTKVIDGEEVPNCIPKAETKEEASNEILQTLSRLKSKGVEITEDVIDVVLATQKERIYVDSPAEIPQGAQMQEGERGGLFYDTEDVEAFEEAMMATRENVINEYNFTDDQVDAVASTLEEYDANAEEDFQRLASAAAESIEGGQYRIKTAASALEKIHARDDASAESVDELGDIFGAMMFAESHDTVEDTAESIKDELGEENIIEEENMMDNDGYYRAYHLDIDLGNGRQGEIQIKSQPMAEIIEVGHEVVYKDEADVDVSGEEVDEVEDCLTEQMDALMGRGGDPDCSERATEIIEAVQ